MRYGGKLLQHVKKCDRAASSIDLHRTGVTELSYSHNGCTNQDRWEVCSVRGAKRYHNGCANIVKHGCVCRRRGGELKA